jgi:class 3 adenylate cyclase/predicted negative regulator of RcsB-dependent stress response
MTANRSREEAVGEAAPDPIVTRAGEAMARQAWDEAYDLFSEADRAGALETDTLPLLADAAYLTGHPEVAVDAWERVHAANVKSGDSVAAAGSAVRVAFFLIDAGLLVPLRSWLRRVDQLLEGQAETAIHGEAAMIRSFASLNTGAPDEALEWARRALDIATRFDDAQTKAIARLAEGRALIYTGHLEEGLAILDEVVTVATAGELNPMVGGLVYCVSVCCWQALADFERAAEWTEAMQGWCDRHAVGSFHGRCRVHRAELLRLRGACGRAEEEARQAREEMRTYAKGELGWPTYEIGQIRLRLGDLAGAEEAFLEAHELGWDPQPGLAMLRLAQGDTESAASSIREALDDPMDSPSQELPPNTSLRRAPRLAAQVEIAIAARDLDRARWAAMELDDIAQTFGTKALRADAAAARGTIQVAEGDPVSARRSYQGAVRLWKELDAPYEVARARVGLATAHRAAGKEDGALLELRTARSIFERLGAKFDLQQVTRLLREARVTRSAAPARARKAFMFTDIVKSTDLVEAIGDEAWGHLVRWHNETLARLVGEHRGEVIQTTGDGFFVAFDSPSEGIDCAVAIQRSLANHRREHGFAPRVRIGLHEAEATKEGANWSGVGVHAAARIGALAAGEEIVVSRDTAQAAETSFGLSEPRTTSLKGISQGVEVVTVDWR